MKAFIQIRRNSYFDSVTLMLLSRRLSEIPGVSSASVQMGTDHNLEILKKSGFESQELTTAGPNDLVIACKSDNSISADEIQAVISEQFNVKRSHDSEDLQPRSIKTALQEMPLANLALISLPGEYAAGEARKCLELGLHTMIFSDNVSASDEKSLKDFARERNLLVMGPDCGTAIINGKPLAFANKVRRGTIGLVGASGTGIQEVSVCIHKLGCGVSQAIGTGGRDLSQEIGGITMLMGLDALDRDPETKLIILISKPPHPSVAKKILSAVKKCSKPVVVNFLGADPGPIIKSGGIPAATLELAAVSACKKIKPEIQDLHGPALLSSAIKTELLKFRPEQKYLRGLYTGGTLCKEAIILLSDLTIWSNIPKTEEFRLPDSSTSRENTILDLGEDEFTRGKPHPMIDPAARTERLLRDSKDATVRVFLFDVMLGYGSHPDPAGELVKGITAARSVSEKRSQHVSFVASVCGVEEDPQVYSSQLQKLKDAGVILAQTNARAVNLARELIQ
ncbi:MAG: acyl-CoA synthetase FdrA [Candidatus Wallbacteria bacterium]|nr:acyl-CoA synthetase FdrA [Candidatus Wallbacteria bacterium]